MKQILYLSTKLADDAISSKERLESLAFAMCIKLTFVSSRVQSATVRRCKALFHVGQDRISRIIRNGIKYGYLMQDGQDLVAVPLRTSDSYHVRLEFNLNTYKFQTGEKSCQYKLGNIMDLIRKSVLLNHISKQSECRDSVKHTQEPCKKSIYKKSKKRVNRMLHAGRMFDGLSNNRIQGLIRVGRAKARRIINSLVSQGLVKKSEVSVDTCLSPETFSKERANAFFKESGNFGYLYKMYDNMTNLYKIMCRVSNRYEYVCDIINFIK